MRRADEEGWHKAESKSEVGVGLLAGRHLGRPQERIVGSWRRRFCLPLLSPTTWIFNEAGSWIIQRSKQLRLSLSGHVRKPRADRVRLLALCPGRGLQEELVLISVCMSVCVWMCVEVTESLISYSVNSEVENKPTGDGEAGFWRHHSCYFFFSDCLFLPSVTRGAKENKLTS